MKVSVIIPAFREVNSEVVDALNAQTYKDFEIIIVKGVSPNGRARNNGVQSAQGEVLVFIDDDAVLVHKEVLTNIVTPIFEDKADIVGASRRIPENSNWFAKAAARQLPLVETPIVETLAPVRLAAKRTSWVKSFMRQPMQFLRGLFDQSVWSPVTTTCVAMKAEVFHSIGGFSEELWWGVDSEFFYRAQQKNFRMALGPDAWVYHPYVSSIAGLWRKYFKSGIGTAHEMKLNPERNIQPQLNSGRNVVWFVAYRFLGMLLFLCIKPIRALASAFSAIGYVYGWFVPKDAISPAEVSHVNTHHLPYFFLLLSILLSPLSYHGTLEIGFTLKISEILLALALATQIFLNVSVQREDGKVSLNVSWVRRIANNPLFLIMLGYCLVAMVSLTRAINVERGLLVLAQTVLFMGGLILLPQKIATSARKVYLLVNTYVFAALLSALLGIFQFFANFLGFTAGLRDIYVKARAGYPRVHATFLEPLYMANYLLTPIALLASRILFTLRNTNAAPLLILLVGLNLGFSRGGWLGLVASIAVLLSVGVWAWFRKYNDKAPKGAVVLVGLVVLSFVVVPLSISLGKFFYSTVGEYVEEHQRTVLENKIRNSTADDKNIAELKRITTEREVTKARVESPPLTFIHDRFGRFFTLAVGDRIDAWQAAVGFVQSSPLVGIGIGNFGYQERQLRVGYEGVNFVNNQFLEVLAETGVLGFVFFVLLNGYWVYIVLNTVRSTWTTNQRDLALLSTGLLAGYAGIMAQFLTVSNWNVYHYWFVLGIGFLLPRLVEKHAN